MCILSPACRPIDEVLSILKMVAIADEEGDDNDENNVNDDDDTYDYHYDDDNGC